MEHQTLGRWVVCPIDPTSQRIILKIVGFLIIRFGRKLHEWPSSICYLIFRFSWTLQSDSCLSAIAIKTLILSTIKRNLELAQFRVYVIFGCRNLTIFNIIRWVDGSMGRLSHWPSVWCSKYYFFNIKPCKILRKNPFNLFFL